MCGVADRYLSLGVLKPKSRQTATEKLRYAIHKFGDRPIASIHKGDVQALISELGNILAPSTIRIVRHHVGATFARAIDDKLIVTNQAVDVRLPRVETPSVVPLTADQVQLLLDAADPWHRVAIVIGAGIGPRSSEAAGLTVDRVDFLRRHGSTGNGSKRRRRWQEGSPPRSRGQAAIECHFLALRHAVRCCVVISGRAGRRQPPADPVVGTSGGRRPAGRR